MRYGAKLEPLLGKRLTFTAMFDKYRGRLVEGRVLTTLLLQNVCYGPKLVRSHVWFDSQPGWRRLRLQHGDIVQFDAVVISYQHRLEDKTWGTDYSLNLASNMKLLSTKGRYRNALKSDPFAGQPARSDYSQVQP